jgi:hypothetical protein
MMTPVAPTMAEEPTGDGTKRGCLRVGAAPYNEALNLTRRFAARRLTPGR